MQSDCWIETIMLHEGSLKFEIVQHLTSRTEECMELDHTHDCNVVLCNCISGVNMYQSIFAWGHMKVWDQDYSPQHLRFIRGEQVVVSLQCCLAEPCFLNPHPLCMQNARCIAYKPRLPCFRNFCNQSDCRIFSCPVSRLV